MNGKLLLLIAAALSAGVCYAQRMRMPEDPVISRWNLKTNILFDVTASPNLGVEVGLGEKTSLDLSGSVNLWDFTNNTKWKHVLVQPEVRYWPKKRYYGFFLGPHGHYANYNVGHLFHPPFPTNLRDYRFDGWLVGGGLTVGYRFNLYRRLGLEAAVGGGYAHIKYKRWHYELNGPDLGGGTMDFFGPTRASLSLIVNIGKDLSSGRPSYITPVVVERPFKEAPSVPNFTAFFVKPEIESVKHRSETVKAFLDYEQNRSEIDSRFRNNAAELAKIQALIEKVKNNPKATITGVRITSYASPEGTYATNLALSKKRTIALKSYIKSMYNIPEQLFTVSDEGEDWTTLDSLVAASGMMDKYRILEIIRGTDIFMGREKKLMDLAGGNPYREMKSRMFPLLRRSEYELLYTVDSFNVPEAREVIKTQPKMLSLEEMFLVANSYPVGSTEFNEVINIAVGLYPGNDTANLNAAACALNRGDRESSASYLSRVSERGKNTGYHNNMGILYALRGEYDRAVTEFELAGRSDGDVVRNLSLLKDYLMELEDLEDSDDLYDDSDMDL
ncbi:MAG: DUF3575 domain-containing protein [Proteiniphilum sp.]|jgi:tetratricopeptide (TPR) repeat protein|nr:DUF3575 domain-containing protein [Proteiniphilum sp.]